MNTIFSSSYGFSSVAFSSDSFSSSDGRSRYPISPQRIFLCRRPFFCQRPFILMILITTVFTVSLLKSECLMARGRAHKDNGMVNQNNERSQSGIQAGTQTGAQPGAGTQAGGQTNSSSTITTAEEIPVLTTNTVLKNLIVPWEIRFLAKDHWLMTERPGYLTILQGEKVKRFKIPGIDHIGEGGLLGLAIHPNFKQTPWIYLYRTIQKNGKSYNQVVRYQLVKNTLSQEKIIVDDIPANSIHNGGRIAFGPDKLLYITTGDAAEPALAWDKSNLAGKILRVDEQGNIPESNPFNNAVFSYGHRNPLSLAWDDKGRLFSTDLGNSGNSGSTSNNDKLNLILKGKSYGLPGSKIKGSTAAQDFEKPVLTSGASNSWAPGGLAFWNSKFYLGSLKGEALYEIDLSSKPVKITKYFENQFGRIRSINVGMDEALYFMTSNQDGQASQKNANDDIVVRIPRPRSRNQNENDKIEAQYPVSQSFR